MPCLEVIIAHRFTCGKRKILLKHRKVPKYYEIGCSHNQIKQPNQKLKQTF